MRNTLIALAAIVVVAAGAFALTRDTSNTNSNPPASQSSTSHTASQTPPSSLSNADQTGSTIITYGNSGFSPATITVKSGSKITVKNTSSHEVDFDSDPHPTHTDDPELNAGPIAPGQSATFTVTTTGNHGYHNHINPSETGRIIVQ